VYTEQPAPDPSFDDLPADRPFIIIEIKNKFNKKKQKSVKIPKFYQFYQPYKIQSTKGQMHMFNTFSSNS